MKFKLPIIIFFFGVMSGVWGNESTTLRPTAPLHYRVAPTDTLWDIAARFLRDPWQWSDIWRLDPQLQNPHLIYPGDVITLTYQEGESPRLELQRKLPYYKISPKIRVSEWEKAIPTVSLDVVRPFLLRPQVVSRKALDTAPYVMAGAEERLILGAGDEVYVRGLESAMALTQYGIYRSGEVYRDPDELNAILGYEALFIAEAKVQQFGDPTIVRIQHSTREVLVGDRLLPMAEEEYEPYFFPHAPTTSVEGKIIAVVDGVSQIAQHQIVALNLGTEEGIEKGSVLGVYQVGRVVRDSIGRQAAGKVRLPEERAGVVMVFQTFEHMSYALIMRAGRPIHVYDLVRNP